MNIKQTAKLHNKFEIKVVNKDTGEIRQTAYAYNVVTDNYFKMRFGMLSSDISMTSSLSYIGVGTGSGTPAITDTALFTSLLHRSATTLETHYEYPTSYVTRQIKINADECNGQNITEVGLEVHYTYGLWSSDGYVLCTHAMLQDAEGHQIAIHKTDVDVVYITATFYCTFTPSGFGNNGVYPSAPNNILVKWIMNGTTELIVRSNHFPLERASQLYDLYDFTKSFTFTNGTGNFENLTWELPVMTILDSEFNNHVPSVIGIPGIGAFCFPDSSVFPDYLVEHLVLGEGDGSTKVFNIKAPLIKEGTVRIFVNNDELQEEAFEVDCESNCVDNRENYYTADMNCQMENVQFGDLLSRSPSTSYQYQDPLYWGKYPISGNVYSNTCQVKQTTPIWIDFGEAKFCNQLRIDQPSIASATLEAIRIEYSDDNENWTPVTYTRTMAQNTIYNYLWKWEGVSARYWRVYSAGYTWTYTLYYSSSSTGTRNGTTHIKSTFYLGKSVPGLTLMTAPQAGQAVDATYELEKPFKTENNIMRLTCSIQLQRG